MLGSVPHEKRRRVARKQMHSTRQSMPRAATRTSERVYWVILCAWFEICQCVRAFVQVQKMGEEESTVPSSSPLHDCGPGCHATSILIDTSNSPRATAAQRQWLQNEIRSLLDLAPFKWLREDAIFGHGYQPCPAMARRDVSKQPPMLTLLQPPVTKENSAHQQHS